MLGQHGHTLVFLAFPPTCGRARSTPKGASLSSSCDFSSSIVPWSTFGLMRIPPMTPIPPLHLIQLTNASRANGEHTAFVTAAASLGPAATYSLFSSEYLLLAVHSLLGLTFIPASITGWLIPSSLVSGVENTGFDGGMVVVVWRVCKLSG